MISLAFATNLQAQTANLSLQGIIKAIKGGAVENGKYDITFKIYRDGNTLGLDVDSTGSNSAQVISKTDGLKFSTAGEAYYFEGEITEVMCIKKDGKVGIGTTDPQNILHVVGDNEQVKIEGTTDANLVLSKNAAAASIGFGATNGSNLMLTNNAGEVSVTGTKVSLNPSAGDVDINGSLKVNNVAEINKEGEALKLIGTNNTTELSFYLTGITGGKNR